MKNVLAVPIIVSLTVIVLAVISQQVTMALYFLPLNNTIVNQEGENVTNQTTSATPSSNQTTLATPTPTPIPTPVPANNRITTPAAPSSNSSLLSYFDPPIQIQDILSIKSYKIWCAKSEPT
jgi:hypothetical protein